MRRPNLTSWLAMVVACGLVLGLVWAGGRVVAKVATVVAQVGRL